MINIYIYIYIYSFILKSLRKAAKVGLQTCKSMKYNTYMHQYQHYWKSLTHVNTTNIKIECFQLLLANINFKNVDFEYAFKFNINIWRKRRLNTNTKIKTKIHFLKINFSINIQRSDSPKLISMLTNVDSSNNKCQHKELIEVMMRRSSI